ncbi:Fur-regulated basic protein FbpA [Bacillus methanolicus]|uniref:Fur-regulated basic protein FbpA n=1 Tax=Bacillus methanolicus TaxID=1471 RepID=UPI0023806A26|nr:Fur-regulated basic protein FbpA [Bacillus methanolicus]MDE3839033.1 Fur-regulated basic protein FbpA [Bacillus methanolicus]
MILHETIKKRKGFLISFLVNSGRYIGDLQFLNELTLSELEKEYRDLKNNG